MITKSKITFVLFFVCFYSIAYSGIAIFDLIDSGDIEQVKTHFIKGKTDKEKKEGLTPVMYCVKRENFEMFSKLLSLGADYSHINKNRDTVRTLIINKKDWIDSNMKERMLLELDNCIKKKDKEDAERLLGGVDVLKKDDKGRTVLMHTVSHGNLDVAKMILEKGADANAKDNSGKSVVDYVCIKKGDEETKAKIIDLIKSYQ